MSIVVSRANSDAGWCLSSMRREGMGLSKMGRAIETRSCCCGLLLTTKARVEDVNRRK